MKHPHFSPTWAKTSNWQNRISHSSAKNKDGECYAKQFTWEENQNLMFSAFLFTYWKKYEGLLEIGSRFSSYIMDVDERCKIIFLAIKMLLHTLIYLEWVLSFILMLSTILQQLLCSDYCRILEIIEIKGSIDTKWVNWS